MKSLKRQRGFIGAGAAILGAGALGAAGSIMGSRAQQRAAGNATNLQQGMFESTAAQLRPFRLAGENALSELQSRMPQLLHPFGLEDFQASPAYQFNLEQGKLALDKASAARGKFYAPSTLQDIAKYSQGVASNEFQNAFSNYQTNMGNVWNRLYSLAGSGQNAAAQLGAFGSNAANNISNNITGAGNAQASGIVGATNAITGAAGNYANNQLIQQILARNQGSSVPGWGNSGQTSLD